MDPRRLELLLQLSRLGSMREVAEAMHITTSTVSQQLAALAKEAGTPLLEHEGRLVPADATGAIQSTQAKVGPYELQDFSLFHITRFGLRPSKVAFLAWHAWRDATTGEWPPGYPVDERPSYALPAIRHWLEVFAYRFFQFSQFKRSAMPNGPKVSAGGSLSPRGDWRAPSDLSARIWLEEIAAIPTHQG